MAKIFRGYVLPHPVDCRTLAHVASCYSVPLGLQSIVVYLFVRLSVCLCVHSYNSKTALPIFCVRYPWPWLGTSLTALRYVM